MCVVPISSHRQYDACINNIYKVCARVCLVQVSDWGCCSVCEFHGSHIIRLEIRCQFVVHHHHYTTGLLYTAMMTLVLVHEYNVGWNRMLLLLSSGELCLEKFNLSLLLVQNVSVEIVVVIVVCLLLLLLQCLLHGPRSGRLAGIGVQHHGSAYTGCCCCCCCSRRSKREMALAAVVAALLQAIVKLLLPSSRCFRNQVIQTTRCRSVGGTVVFYLLIIHIHTREFLLLGSIILLMMLFDPIVFVFIKIIRGYKWTRLIHHP